MTNRSLPHWLSAGLLLILCVLGLQAVILLRNLTAGISDARAATLRLLADADSTVHLAQSSLETQQGYYRDTASHVKALTGAAAHDAVQLGRLIESLQLSVRRTDERIERLSTAAEAAIGSGGEAASALTAEVHSVGEESAGLLREAKKATADLGALAADPGVKDSLDNLDASSRNLRATTAAASEAMERIREMLSPKKKSFWRRLLELMIPRPTLRVP